MSNINIKDLTPEELVELINSGKDFSQLQTNEPSCSLGSQVKNEGPLLPSPVVGDSFQATQSEAEGANPRRASTDTNTPSAARGENLRPIVVNSLRNLENTLSASRVQSRQVIDQYETVENKGGGKEGKLIGEINNPTASTIEFDGLDIANPVELLVILDENIQSGVLKLHPWQVQFMLDFADNRHTKESPFQAVVQACNSSGKDKYIIAACAVWLCMRYSGVECPITSSSGNQLDNQTGAHIDRLCNKANAVFGKLWKVNYRYYEFQHTGKFGESIPSTLKLFATDEAGKAEGYHPTEAGKRMAIFTSETKSIPEQITSALERCIGFTHRVDASSPGLPAGYFYDTCSSGIPRTEVEDIKSLYSTQVLKYHITAYDCPHITHSEIERFASKLPGGKNNVVFKSGIMAEFGTTDEMVVIPSSFVWKAVRSKKTWLKEDFNTGGLDLSDGGAENVLVIRNGNKMIGMEAFRFEDTQDTISYLEEKFKFYELNHQESKIFADCCGIGKPMIDSLKARGWKNMRYVDSRNTPTEARVYYNRGTELFFNVRKLMEGEELLIMNDKLLITQLCTRYYKISTKNIHCLLSKLEQKSRGFPSPDRADAFNLAFWNYKSTREIEEVDAPYVYKEPEVKQKPIPSFDLKEWSNRGQVKYQVDHVAEDDLEALRDEISQYNKRRKQLVNN